MDVLVGWLFGCLVCLLGGFLRTDLFCVITQRVVVRKPIRAQFAATSGTKLPLLAAW
jgi:hypothetical protein